MAIVAQYFRKIEFAWQLKMAWTQLNIFFLLAEVISNHDHELFAVRCFTDFQVTEQVL